MASKNANGESYGKGRIRNFGCFVYPDSAPQNWQEILADQFVPALISPLHDLDTNPDGEIKKSHWHVVIMYDSPKTKEQAQALIALISGVGCEPINSIRGYARYLCHLDNPEKHQYPPEDVKTLCGADYMGLIGLVTDKYKAISEIIDYCEQNNVFSFAELITYSRTNHFDWFRVLCDNGTVVVKEYLKSRKWTYDNRDKEVIRDVDNS